jgi:hypothetical protein
MIQLQGQFLGATVTDGTGGTAPTPAPVDPGDAAASFTAKVNNQTTQASSSGTTNTLYQNAVHIYAGDDHTYNQGGVTNPVVGPSESYVLSCPSVVSGTVHLSGTIWVEEIGG